MNVLRNNTPADLPCHMYYTSVDSLLCWWRGLVLTHRSQST